MPHPVAPLAVGKTVRKILILPPELHQATDSLIENLLASEVFLAYHQALTTMNSDLQARALLEHLSALQAELRLKQSSNSVGQPDVDELRIVQEQVQSNAVIMAYATSQQGAVNFLREINQEISQLLGMDFAALAKQNTCC